MYSPSDSSAEPCLTRAAEGTHALAALFVVCSCHYWLKAACRALIPP